MSRKLKPKPKLTVAKKQSPRWQRERSISLLIWIIIPLIIVLALGLVGYWAYDSYVADPRVSQADGYMVKSFVDFDQLKQKMADILGRRSVNRV